MSPCARRWMSPAKGDTVCEARDNLAEALTLFFETASSQEIDGCRAGEVYVTHVDIAVGQILSESGGTAAPPPRFDLARPGLAV